MIELKTRKRGDRCYRIFNGTKSVGEVIRYHRSLWGFRLDGIFFRAGVPNRIRGVRVGPLSDTLGLAVKTAQEILERMEKE